jgi:hypothetical protein
MRNKQAKCIFIGVLLYAFAVQLVIRNSTLFIDKNLWANEIAYFLNHDPRVFDMLGAYGHPGGTLIAVGILFHIFFGLSYSNALIFSVSLLIATTTAACATLCFLLYPGSLWWMATAFILTFSRFYIDATPPTAVVIPFIALAVLTTWWTGLQYDQKSQWKYFIWGIIAGLAAATRLDVSLLVGVPMFVLLWCQNRNRVVLPILAGFVITFFLADPFMWFMPIQHLLDLTRKFMLHHNGFSQPTGINAQQIIQAFALAAICIIWWVALLGLRRSKPIIPNRIMGMFLAVSLFAFVVILSSTFQALRYFYPLIIVWEIFLPLLALETFSPANRQEPSGSFPSGTVTSWSIIGLAILTQILSYGLTI